MIEWLGKLLLMFQSLYNPASRVKLIDLLREKNIKSTETPHSSWGVAKWFYEFFLLFMVFIDLIYPPLIAGLIVYKVLQIIVTHKLFP